MQTYLTDSFELKKIDNLGKLDPRARLFTYNAKSMCTSISTEYALEVIRSTSETINLTASQLLTYIYTSTVTADYSSTVLSTPVAATSRHGSILCDC